MIDEEDKTSTIERPNLSILLERERERAEARQRRALGEVERPPSLAPPESDQAGDTPSALNPGQADITAERPGVVVEDPTLAKVDASPASGMDPVRRMRAFLQGESVLAELYELRRDELMKISLQGQAFFESGRVEDAAMLFEGLTALDPTEWTFHAGFGAALQALGAHENALVEYDRSLALNDLDIASRTNRAELLIEHGQLDRAAEDLRRIAELDPGARHPHSQRARARALALATMAQDLIEQQTGDSRS